MSCVGEELGINILRLYLVMLPLNKHRVFGDGVNVQRMVNLIHSLHPIKCVFSFFVIGAHSRNGQALGGFGSNQECLSLICPSIIKQQRCTFKIHMTNMDNLILMNMLFSLSDIKSKVKIIHKYSLIR